MYEHRADGPCFLGENAGHDAVDERGQILLGLGAIDGRVRGGIDNDRGPCLAHRAANRRKVRYIERHHRRRTGSIFNGSGRGDDPPHAGQRAQQLAPHLARGAR